MVHFMAEFHPSCTQSLVMSAGGAKATRKTAVTVWQSSALLVNHSCGIIQNVAEDNKEKKGGDFQNKTLSKLNG